MLEPGTPLEWNWHLDYLCDELQLQVERIKNREPREYHLLINVPPRSLKTKLITKMLNPWAWIIDPTQRFLTTSYSGTLAIDHAVDSRRVIQSDWYQGHWADRYCLTSDQNVKSNFKNDKSGYRIIGSVGGTGTGRGGNWVIADDPISAEEAESPIFRQRCIRWWTRTMASRLNTDRTE